MKTLWIQATDLYRTSLTVKTLLNMSLRVALVVLVSTTASYFHVMHNLEAQTIQQLERYITERGQRESSIFQLAEDNLVSLRDRFVAELGQPLNQDIATQFNQQFFRWQDGTARNFPEEQPISAFDTAQNATSFVNKDTGITPSLQQQLLIAQHLITSHGIAWSNRFINTYLNTAENTTTIYWQDTPLALQANADFKPSQDEYFYVADPQHNPTRQPAWTGVYSDTVTNVWMMSAAVPLYKGKQFIGSFGHDIKLNSLIEQTVNNSLPGAYNIIFDRNGRLIAHPQYVDKIQQAQGQLNINNLADEHLKTIFQLSLSRSQDVIRNPKNKEFLALTNLSGPDWLFVTVYPKSLLSDIALDTIQFVLIAGLSALLVEVILLFFVLKNQVASPLSHLTTASQKLADGDFDDNLQTTRQDELGQLASSFTKMAHQLQSTFQDLQKKIAEKEQAEVLILEKNNALEQAFKELQTAQLQTVQNEKMATLGNLVAGVAHEINNPIGFLNGSIKNAENYIQDLFEHLEIYQKHQPPNETVQESAEDVDLEFLLADFPKLLNSMRGATDRIKSISTSLRTFSRADMEKKVKTDLHAGLDSTILILKYRLKANEHRPEIVIKKNYGTLPEIECFPGQLNQVFMNILANAIDMFDEMAQQTTFENLKHNPQKITIQTGISAPQTAVEVRISDNGKGMSQEVKSRIFENLFTTKAVGKGTGLGMAITHEIITETHSGEIIVETTLGQGSTFMISLPISCQQQPNAQPRC
ncbi:MAG: ATP-binding protein [Cyanobacteria bacterium P01_D01_bin.105]